MPTSPLSVLRRIPTPVHARTPARRARETTRQAGELPTRTSYGWSGVAWGGEEFLVSADTGDVGARAAFCTGCDYLIGVYAVSDADFSMSFSVVGGMQQARSWRG